MIDLEKAQAHIDASLRKRVAVFMWGAVLYGFVLTIGLGIESYQTQRSVIAVRADAQQINDLRTIRAADIAAQSERNCEYTTRFVSAVKAWAASLGSAEKQSAQDRSLSPAERQWHQRRIAAFSRLFGFLKAIGDVGCPPPGSL